MPVEVTEIVREITVSSRRKRITITGGPTGPGGVGVPVGGTTGQVLAKKTNTDHDTEWVDPSGGGSAATLEFVGGYLHITIGGVTRKCIVTPVV